MLSLDHIAVLGETLEEAAGHVETSLGTPMQPGGKHAHFATHNKLLGLGSGLYVEAIATDPAAPPPPYARWFGLDRFRGPPRLDKWICRVPDMAAALDALPMAGQPVTLTRGTLEWTISVPEDGMLPFDGLFPALIQWHSPVPPGTSLSSSSVALDMLTITHPDGDELTALLGDLLAEGPVRIRAGARAQISAQLSVDHTTKTLQ